MRQFPFFLFNFKLRLKHQMQGFGSGFRKDFDAGSEVSIFSSGQIPPMSFSLTGSGFGFSGIFLSTGTAEPTIEIYASTAGWADRYTFHLVNAFTAFLNSGFRSGDPHWQPGFYIFFGTLRHVFPHTIFQSCSYAVSILRSSSDIKFYICNRRLALSIVADCRGLPICRSRKWFFRALHCCAGTIGFR